MSVLVLCVTKRSFILLAIVCRTLSNITNGVITYAPNTTPNYDLGTVATYACTPGFVLDLSLGGSEMRTCVDDNGLDAIGVFDNQEPRCIRKSAVSTAFSSILLYDYNTMLNAIYPAIQCPPLPAITNTL